MWWFVIKRVIVLWGVSVNNLKGIEVKILVGIFVVVIGVSGVGKSLLVIGILLFVLFRVFYNVTVSVGVYDSFEGLEYLDKVVVIN